MTGHGFGRTDCKLISMITKRGFDSLGFRCIGGTVYRLDVTVAVAGVLSHALDVTDPPSPGGQITAGSTWNFQAWFRDPAGGGAAFNLSDGLNVTFSP